jgi:hypothetical protein
VLLAVAIGGWNERFKDVTKGALDGAKTAVTIALGLIGIMALWLGVTPLAEQAGLFRGILVGKFPPLDCAQFLSAGLHGCGIADTHHVHTFARAPQ